MLNLHSAPTIVDAPSKIRLGFVDKNGFWLELEALFAGEEDYSILQKKSCRN